MRRLAICAWIALAAASCATQTSKQSGLQPPLPASQLYLWRASHPERPGTAWIVGSIHVGRSQAPQLDRAVVDAFQRSSRVAVEVDITRLGDTQGLFATMLKYGFYPEGQSLSQALEEPLRQRVREQVAALGFDPSLGDRLRPWFVYLLTSMDTTGTGTSFETGVDIVLINAAHGAGKPVLSLETMEDQLAALASAPESLQIRLLEDALGPRAGAGPTVTEMLEAYEAGDDDALLDEVRRAGSDAELNAYVDRVLRQRNKTMAASIDREMRSPGDLLTVVGALHVLGEASVLEELRAKGYTIERLAATGERVALPTPNPTPPPRAVVGHTIDLPRPVQRQTIPLANGRTLEGQVAHGDGVAYIATVEALPPMAGFSMPGFFFDATEHGVAQSVNATVADREELLVDGLPARLTTFRSSAAWARILLVRGDDEVFLVMAVSRASDPDEHLQAQIENVLSSFHPHFANE